LLKESADPVETAVNSENKYSTPDCSCKNAKKKRYTSFKKLNSTIGGLVFQTRYIDNKTVVCSGYLSAKGKVDDLNSLHALSLQNTNKFPTLFQNRLESGKIYITISQKKIYITQEIIRRKKLKKLKITYELKLKPFLFIYE
jgi:hypothetical protein